MSDCALKPGWRRVRFGDVVRQIKERVDPETSGLERYVAGEHMDTDDLRIRRWGTIGDGYLGPAFHMRFREGHVLYGSRRTYLRKVAQADFDGVCANTTFVLEARNGLLPELLPYIMQTPAFVDHSVKQSRGSVNPYVNFSDLAWFEFPLPSSPDQQRIIALLRTAREQVESADALLEATRAVRASLVESIGETGPDSAPLSAIVDPERPITYGIVKPGLHYDGGIPVVKVKDYPNGKVLTDDLLLTSPAIEKDYRRSRLCEGDLLFSIRGTIGRTAVVPRALDGANITQDTARIAVRKEVNPFFVRAALELRQVQSQVTSRVTGLAVKGINLSELREVRIPLPSRKVQDEIAGLVGGVEEGIAAAVEREHSARTLYKHLVDAAFERGVAG